MTSPERAGNDVTGLGITVYGCDQVEAAIFSELSPRFGVTPTVTSAAASERTALSVGGNRCVSVGHKSEVPESTLRALKEAGVEYISTRSIGLDHIDLQAAAQIGITVENVEYAPDGVADHTLMLMLMAVRHAKAIVSAAGIRDFRLRSVPGNELRDMTVGVLGVGHVGGAVIRRLRGFGCRVLAHSARRQAAVAADYVSLDELLLESDILTLHVPLTTDTRHLIGRRQIRMMKPGAILVNTARGALVDTDALIDALESGRLGGAALDVLEGERGLFYFDCTDRPIRNHSLLRLQAMPNVIVTPHTAYHTRPALYEIVATTITNCLSFERRRAHA